MARAISSPDRLERTRRYAAIRARELDAIARIAAVLRAELPDLSEVRAGQVATAILEAVQDDLADALSSNPDAAARAVIAFAMGES